jgi:hypothetical protein
VDLTFRQAEVPSVALPSFLRLVRIVCLPRYRNQLSSLSCSVRASSFALRSASSLLSFRVDQRGDGGLRAGRSIRRFAGLPNETLMAVPMADRAVAP